MGRHIKDLLKPLKLALYLGLFQQHRITHMRALTICDGSDQVSHKHKYCIFGQAIEHHRRKVRFYSTVELVNTLEQKKGAREGWENG